MSQAKPVLIIAGTNRPESNALRVAKVLASLYARAGVPHGILSLTEMPPEAFLPTTYAAKPPGVVALQQRVLDAGGLHVVTPEYNGSFPGVLKYFIDLLKFPESFEGKPVAIVGEAMGAWGGLRPVEQLAQVFAYRNAFICPQRVFIPQIHKKLAADGTMADAEIAQILQMQCTAFAAFVAAVGK